MDQILSRHFFYKILSVFYHLNKALKLSETLLIVCWATINYASSWKRNTGVDEPIYKIFGPKYVGKCPQILVF